MKTFWTKKNIAIVLAVLLVAAVVVLCIALRQKSVEDTEPTLTLTCQSADADGACTVECCALRSAGRCALRGGEPRRGF